jgi:hypothetical protein
MKAMMQMKKTDIAMVTQARANAYFFADKVMRSQKLSYVPTV